MAFEWTAPEGTIVVWSLEAKHGVYHPSLLKTAPKGAMTSATLKRRLASFSKRFKLKAAEYSSMRTPLADPRWPEIIAWLKDPESADGLAMGSCWLEEPEPPTEDPSLWFQIEGSASEMRTLSRPPKNTHFIGFEVRGRVWTDLVSEPLYTVIKAARLRGLEVLPMVQSKPSDPMIWYEGFALEPLGRMLHHPLIDEGARRAHLGSSLRRERGAAFNPAYQRGIPKAELPFFHKSATLTPPLVGTLRSMAPRYFRVCGPVRAVREFLPTTDFAYFGWNDPQDKPEREPGMPRRHRHICCNAKARAALLRSGLIKPDRFKPIVIVDEANARAEVFDRTIKKPLPLPAYTAEEAELERTQRAQLMKPTAAGRTKPRKTLTIPSMLEELNRRLAEKSTAWRPLRDDALFRKIQKSKLLAKTPLAWQQLLPLLPTMVWCMEQDFEFEVIPPEHTPWDLDDEADDSGGSSEKPHPKDIAIACVGNGDWYAIRPSDPLMPNDASVVHWSHETLSAADQWPSVCAFVAHILEARDHALAKGEDPSNNP